MKTIRTALLVLTGAYAPATAPEPPAKDIDRFVQRMLKTIPEIPSLGIAVIRDGRVLYVRGAGYRSRERQIASDAQTAYYIGSTTKSYTGLACAILAERGVIDLDAPISKYLPELKTRNEPLRAFLTHTAGVENDAIVFRTTFSGEHTPAQMIALLDSSNPRDPGFRYDNLGYVVASLVIERVTGRPWQQALDDLVFTPLGMNHTSAYMSEARRWPMAVPHEITRKGEVAPLIFTKNDQMMHAAGGIVTTPEDLARWMQANVMQGRLDNRQRIPAAAFEQAQKRQAAVTPANSRSAFTREAYGFGWYQGEFDGHAILSHGGGFPGWQSLYSFMPREKIAVGVMTNVGATVPALEILSGYIYERLLDEPNVEARYAEKLATLRDDLQRSKANTIANFERIAGRPSMLQHPNAAYVGRYENAQIGSLVIQERDGKLFVSIGSLKSDVEAFTETESARVELVPGTEGVLRFFFSGACTADSVDWGDDVFRRVN